RGNGAEPEAPLGGSREALPHPPPPLDRPTAAEAPRKRAETRELPLQENRQFPPLPRGDQGSPPRPPRGMARPALPQPPPEAAQPASPPPPPPEAARPASPPPPE